MKEMKQLTPREARFAIEYVNGYDRYEAFKKAGFTASSHASMKSAVSRLLARPKVKNAVAELERSIQEAAMVTPARIIANIAGIAFDKNGSKADRLRALEMLGKQQALFTDRIEKLGGDMQQIVVNVVDEKGRMPLPDI